MKAMDQMAIYFFGHQIKYTPCCFLWNQMWTLPPTSCILLYFCTSYYDPQSIESRFWNKIQHL